MAKRREAARPGALTSLLSGWTVDTRAAIGLVVCAVLASAAAAVAFTLDDKDLAAWSFADLEPLFLYVAAAIVLVLTANGAAAENLFDPVAEGRPRVLALAEDRWLATWLAGAVSLALYNAARLRHDIADDAGPALWLLSIALVVVAVAPSTRTRVSFDLNRRRRLVWSALAALLAVAVVARVVDLAGVPPNVQADEGDRAGSALQILDGTALPSWFDSGWYYISNVYFRLLAGVFDVFGVGVVQGRAVNAVAGIVLVATVAWIGFRHFNSRVGLVATALAAVSPFGLQFSRTIAESGVGATLAALSAAGFLEGARRGRSWAFAVAGLAGGLGLYTYPAARQWPIGAGLTVAILLLFGWERRRLVVRGAIIAAVCALVAALPFIVHLRQHPDEVTLRFRQTTVLSAENRTRLGYTRPDMPLAEVLVIQGERSLGMFDRYEDGSDFLPTGKPLFPLPLAALTLLGIFYANVRGLRDPRLAILSLWFWLGLSGVVLTVETPAAQRAAGLVFTLPLFAAVVLDDVARRLASVRAAGDPPVRFPARNGRLRLTVNGILGLVVAGFVAWQLAIYFVDYRHTTEPWSSATNEAHQVASLGRFGPVYSLERSEHRVASGWVRFLARGVRTGRVPDPGAELPVLRLDEPSENQRDGAQAVPVPGAGEALSFLLYGAAELPYAGLLRSVYGGGTVSPRADDRVAFQVPSAAAARTRGVRVRVNGRIAATRVSTFGDVPPRLQLPRTIDWSAGVRIANSGRHRFELQAPGPATLRLDSVTIATTRGRRVAADVRVPRGLHFLQLTAAVSSRNEHISVRHSGKLAAAPLQPALRSYTAEQTYAPMAAPWGLLGHLSAQPEHSWPDETFVTATLATSFVDTPLPTSGRIIWRGALRAPRAGPYRMAFVSDAEVHVAIDGIMPAHPSSFVRLLSRGRHAIEVTMTLTAQRPNFVRWMWVPPRQDGRVDNASAWSIVSPSVLRPTTAVRVVARM
jgi:4-amino-4-deoxy-L-arabinose transferase-like glycosyltransferase